MRILPILLVLVGLLGAVGLSSIFIINERQQALVLEFGRVVRVEAEPGLNFKLPWPFNTVVYFDDRILPIETDDLIVNVGGAQRLRVRAFARYRISDPQRFREAVQEQRLGESRLRQLLNAEVRRVLGGVPIEAILSDQRDELMQDVLQAVRAQAAGFGVEVVDARIKRADLPDANLQATYDRMRAERQQEAADERAFGRAAAEARRAEADRLAVTEVAEAERQAQIIRGEADADRNRIFAEAYGQDPEFFAFLRSLRAYEEALRAGGSTLVLSPESDFFSYFSTFEFDEGLLAPQ